MNKTEINAQLDALESELDSSGVEYTKADRDQTNAELEKEITRLELLLPDQGDEPAPNISSDEMTSAVETSKTCMVKIIKGVNIEIMLSGKKKILQGGQSYALPQVRAHSVVAEKLGTFSDDGV